mmetsp:Transcript_9545/g.21923  ORF Transcript_9545/g.21923 Transcript_9545/m.21923 type:complete len:84 (+) Transcript_9545:326-577(+)
MRNCCDDGMKQSRNYAASCKDSVWFTRNRFRTSNSGTSKKCSLHTRPAELNLSSQFNQIFWLQPGPEGKSAPRVLASATIDPL